MIKFKLFLKHLKRFLKLSYKEIKIELKIRFNSERLYYLIEPLLIIMLLALVGLLIGAILLSVSIICTSWLHFFEDFSIENVVVSAGTSMLTIVLAGAGITGTLHTFNSTTKFIQRCWEATSIKAIAKELWE